MAEERKTIYLCLAHMSEEGWEQKYVKEAFDTNWVVPMGPNVNAFEEDLGRFVNGKVVCLSAGTAAVHLALIACGVQPGDEVCVQSFTFCASSHPITYLGAKPVFIDSERETWNMDPAALERAFALYNEAAEEDFPAAYTALGLCFENGSGTEADIKQIVEAVAENTELRYKATYYSSLGEFVNSNSDVITCNSDIFKENGQGTCLDNNGKLFLAWNMRAKNGRLASTGVYIARLEYRIKVGSKTVVDRTQDFLWGVRRGKVNALDFGL